MACFTSSQEKDQEKECEPYYAGGAKGGSEVTGIIITAIICGTMVVMVFAGKKK